MNREIEVHAFDLGLPVGGLATGRRYGVTVRREVIPIVFVPGIMGSRLRIRGGRTVWDPDDRLLMLLGYVRPTSRPAMKKARLVGTAFHPKHLEVDLRNPRVKNPDGLERGWGGIAWGMYGPFIEQLERLRGDGGLARELTAGRGKLAPIDTPVHAFGYNWTASNRDSGEKLKAFIGEVIGLYRRSGRECRQVVLVTHSMGGLVARSACMLHGAASMVLGVVHGVQPATGSAAAYWRMRAGFPRPERSDVAGYLAALALGHDAREVTALLGNMPGGLELLPNRNYTTNDGRRKWLRWTEPDGTEVDLPRAGDACAEIYLEREEPWRLIAKPEWLAPGAPTRAVPRVFGSATDPWPSYTRRVESAAKFHDDLALKQHPRTHHFSGVGEPTPATISFGVERDRLALFDSRRTRLSSGGRRPLKADAVCAALSEAERSTGGCSFYVPIPIGGRTDYVLQPTHAFLRYTLSPAEDDGDGTVPASSGEALRTQPGTRSAEPLRGFTHDAAYEDRGAQQFAVDSIAGLLHQHIQEARGVYTR